MMLTTGLMIDFGGESTKVWDSQRLFLATEWDSASPLASEHTKPYHMFCSQDICSLYLHEEKSIIML